MECNEKFVKTVKSTTDPAKLEALRLECFAAEHDADAAAEAALTAYNDSAAAAAARKQAALDDLDRRIAAADDEINTLSAAYAAALDDPAAEALDAANRRRNTLTARRAAVEKAPLNGDADLKAAAVEAMKEFLRQANDTKVMYSYISGRCAELRAELEQTEGYAPNGALYSRYPQEIEKLISIS